MIDRRQVFAGTAAALLAGSARAAPDPPLFVSGPMAHNPLAASFKAPSGALALPDTPLLSAHGPQKLSQLQGRVFLVSLWAEWCTPCLAEAGDLAALGRAHDGPSFGVIFVLTGSGKKLDLAGAKAVLAQRGAGDAPLFVEAGGAATVINALATQSYGPEMRAIAKQESGPSLPCNLLIDRHGQVRGRAFGTVSVAEGEKIRGSVTTTTTTSHVMTAADKARALATHTLWASPAAHEFAAALAAGVLEKA
jgi:thiol-disulfide isomerase/thioredoxin